MLSVHATSPCELVLAIETMSALYNPMVFFQLELSSALLVQKMNRHLLTNQTEEFDCAKVLCMYNKISKPDTV